MKGKKRGAFVFDSTICLLNKADIGTRLAAKKHVKNKSQWMNQGAVGASNEGLFVQIFIITAFDLSEFSSSFFF